MVFLAFSSVVAAMINQDKTWLTDTPLPQASVLVFIWLFLLFGVIYLWVYRVVTSDIYIKANYFFYSNLISYKDIMEINFIDLGKFSIVSRNGKIHISHMYNLMMYVDILCKIDRKKTRLVGEHEYVIGVLKKKFPEEFELFARYSDL